LKSGTVFKELQLENILLISVTADVLNNGIDFNDTQKLNMPLVRVILVVSRKEINFKE
jgi:hypothetical protein